MKTVGFGGRQHEVEPDARITSPVARRSSLVLTRLATSNERRVSGLRRVGFFEVMTSEHGRCLTSSSNPEFFENGRQIVSDRLVTQP